MRISADVREYAEKNGMNTQEDIDRVLAQGMSEKSAEFAANGGQVYLPLTSVN